jgi:hypothetical protein
MGEAPSKMPAIKPTRDVDIFMLVLRVIVIAMHGQRASVSFWSAVPRRRQPIDVRAGRDRPVLGSWPSQVVDGSRSQECLIPALAQSAAQVEIAAGRTVSVSSNAMACRVKFADGREVGRSAVRQVVITAVTVS